jgi:hypothetical protein
MVKSLCCLILLFSAIDSFSQISVVYNSTKNEFTKNNDYPQEGSDLWVGIGVNGLVLKETNSIDTVDIFSSFGCVQYQISDSTFTIYLWLDYYYGGDCLCTENDISCKPDTSYSDLKIRFYSTPKGLSCHFSKITIKDINSENLAIFSSYLCSKDYVKLRKKDCFIVNNEQKKTIDYTYLFLGDYLKILTYLYEIKNTKCSMRFSRNVKFILKNEKSKKNDDYSYYEMYSNYSNLIIKYLYPLQGKSYCGQQLKRKLKEISMLSKR